MITRSTSGGEAAREDFWGRFESRLCELPATADDAVARAELVQTASGVLPSVPTADVSANAFADVAYRLRYVLGPTVAPETLADVRLDLVVERERLLREGVSPQLLG